MVTKSVRSGKRKLTKTPGGRTYYKSVKASAGVPTCATCSRLLPGTAKGHRNAVRKMTHTQRRPSRPYGGQLCSPCLRRKLILDSRRN